MKLELYEVICPRCGGKGKVKVSVKQSRGEYTLLNRKQAYEMRQNGMTIRAIGKKLGVKHPGSVDHLIKSWEKKLIQNQIFTDKVKGKEKRSDDKKIH